MRCAGICPQSALELKQEISYPPYGAIEQTIKATSQKSYILPVSQLALELGDIRMVNILMIGALLAFEKVPLKYEVLQQAIGQILKPSVVEMNLHALEAGRDLIKKYF
jgi:Pyruvate/2-oxoacid:ferredoxin oxidoreductase gamma subunit